MKRPLVHGLLGLVLAASGLVRANELARGAPSTGNGGPYSTDLAFAAVERDEQALRSELQSVGDRERAATARMMLRGRAFYRMVRVGFLPAGGGFSALLEHAIQLERARRALDADVAEARAAALRKLTLLRGLEDLATRKVPLEVERQAARVAADADDRKRSFDRAFETSTGAGDYVAVYGAVGTSLSPGGPPAAVPDGFRSLKGKLPFPIAGRAEVRRVRRPGAPGPGLEMQAPPGTPVRAVAAGRVAFADRYDRFGQIVILDHGDHYYTVMGDLGAIDVRVGDDLSAGAKVGSVGAPAAAVPSADPATPAAGVGPSRAALYFEVRHGATAVDPSLWLGL